MFAGGIRYERGYYEARLEITALSLAQTICITRGNLGVVLLLAHCQKRNFIFQICPSKPVTEPEDAVQGLAYVDCPARGNL